MLLKNDVRMDVPKTFVENFTKPVTFELCESQTPINPATKKRQFPRSRGLEPFYSYFEKQQMVTLRYADQKQPGKIPGQFDYSPTEIEFLSKGNIVLDPTVARHIELYFWLFNHPQNQSSPNRDDKKMHIFYQVNEEKKAEEKIGKRKARHDAEEKILNEWSETQLKEIALGFGDTLALEKTVPMLQDFLLTVMEKDPVGFFKKATAEDMAMRANIVEGLALKVIVFNDPERTFYWGADPEKNGAEICKVPTEQDEKSRLIKFFNTALKSENEEYFMERLTEARKVEAKRKEASLPGRSEKGTFAKKTEVSV